MAALAKEESDMANRRMNRVDDPRFARTVRRPACVRYVVTETAGGNNLYAVSGKGNTEFTVDLSNAKLHASSKGADVAIERMVAFYRRYALRTAFRIDAVRDGKILG